MFVLTNKAWFGDLVMIDRSNLDMGFDKIEMEFDCQMEKTDEIMYTSI